LGIGIGASGCFENYAIFYRNQNRSFGIIPGTENVIFFSGIQMATTKQIRGDNGNASITLEQTANGNLAISAVSGIKFQSSFVDKMTLTSDGKLGIGTTTPSGTLHVVGNTNISGVLTATSGSITTLNTVPTFTSPSALGSSQGDWNPGAGDVIRASASVSGVAISGIFLGNEYTRVLINVGTTNNLTLKHQASTATSGYRIITPNGGDYIVQPTGAATILYDIVDNRWRVL
jgi:hypothetical protein